MRGAGVDAATHDLASVKQRVLAEAHKARTDLAQTGLSLAHL